MTDIYSLKILAYNFLTRAKTDCFNSKEIGMVGELIAQLQEEGSDGALDAADALTDEFPGAGEWDVDGNWVGSVANENGWTA